MGLLDYNESYKPFQYPWAVEFAEVHEKLHWVEQEIVFDDDIAQWNSGVIHPGEKRLVEEIMRTFTQSDTQVAQGYSDYFIPIFKNNEVRQMLLSFAAREGIHQRAYALFTDTIGLPEEQYAWFLENAKMRKRMDEMVNMDIHSYTGIGLSIGRTVISEGVALFGAFAMLLNFQRFGKLPGLCKVNEWSVRDEQVHVDGMTKLFREFCEEHPRIVTDDFKKDLYDRFRLAVKLEDHFIDTAYSQVGEIDGLDKNDVKKYIRYLADRRLIQLGLKGNWKVKDNPLTWMDELIASQGLSNFFEQRVTDYSAAGLSGSWGWDSLEV